MTARGWPKGGWSRSGWGNQGSKYPCSRAAAPFAAATAIELQQAVIAVIIIKQCHRRSRGDPSKRGIGCVTTDMGICANRGIPLGRLSSGEKMNRSQNWSIAKKCCDADGKRERLHGAAVGMALGGEREESHTLRHVISRYCPTCQI